MKSHLLVVSAENSQGVLPLGARRKGWSGFGSGPDQRRGFFANLIGREIDDRERNWSTILQPQYTSSSTSRFDNLR